jgi:LytS/YehU family sensor histidine kinase
MGIDPDALDASVPHLILQPLIERAIGDDALDNGTASRIDIGAHRHNGTLSLEVRSAGKRPSSEGAVTRLETRFRSTRARLEQVYGPLHRVDVLDRGAEGLVLKVELPFRSSGPRLPATREEPLAAMAAD